MTKLTDEQRRELSAPIPGDSVAQRKGAGGMTLDYVEGHWVIAELNRILGPDGWSFSLLSLDFAEQPHERKTKRGTARACSFLARGRIEFADGSHREDVGFGSGMGPTDGDAIESASKEASTDVLKRCARQMGNRTGGALYEKPDDSGQRTHVDDRPQWAKDAMQAVADLRAEAEAGSGSIEAAKKTVAEMRGAIVKLPKQHKATVLEDLTAVAELVTEGDARATAIAWITGQKAPEKAA